MIYLFGLHLHDSYKPTPSPLLLSKSTLAKLHWPAAAGSVRQHRAASFNRRDRVNTRVASITANAGLLPDNEYTCDCTPAAAASAAKLAAIARLCCQIASQSLLFTQPLFCLIVVLLYPSDLLFHLSSARPDTANQVALWPVQPSLSGHLSLTHCILVNVSRGFKRGHAHVLDPYRPYAFGTCNNYFGTWLGPAMSNINVASRITDCVH